MTQFLPFTSFPELTRIIPGTPFFKSVGCNQRSLTDTAIQGLYQEWRVGESSVDPRQNGVLSPTMFTALP